MPVARPVATYAILAVTILVYLGQYLSKSMTGDDWLLILGANNTRLIANWQIWRLLTPALLHFSLIHIGSNMYSLFILGPSLESFYGHGRFLALYVLSAIGGNLLSFYMHNERSISAGASTAIFGLIAAQGVFVFLNRRMFGARARGMLNNIIFLIALNLVIGVSMGFDNWGHLGGLLTGLAFAWFAGPQLGVEPTGAGYTLADSRSGRTAWTVGLVMLVILGALAFVRIIALS